MSILSDMLHDLLAVICPARCLGCGKLLDSKVDWLCIPCRAEMPSTHFHMQAENAMWSKINALCPSVVNAAGQYYFSHNSLWREVIHAIKYRHSWIAAYKLGYIYGCELKESPLYADIDVVVPIPLHWRRLLARRYNQSELIARGIAAALEVKIDTRSVRRKRYNDSQVTQSKEQRWENVKGIFKVVDNKPLANRHLLLIDDVFTTGATMTSCIDAITLAEPTCRISVATLAVSRREVLGLDL
ncbi:MAG: phosphoribosyltransferase family protein [Rikenellaceae bacterium]